MKLKAPSICSSICRDERLHRRHGPRGNPARSTARIAGTRPPTLAVADLLNADVASSTTPTTAEAWPNHPPSETPPTCRNSHLPRQRAQELDLGGSSTASGLPTRGRQVRLRRGPPSGAMFLDLEEDLSGGSRASTAAIPARPAASGGKLGSLGVGPDTQVVAAYDLGGMFTAARL